MDWWIVDDRPRRSAPSHKPEKGCLSGCWSCLTLIAFGFIALLVLAAILGVK